MADATADSSRQDIAKRSRDHALNELLYLLILQRRRLWRAVARARFPLCAWGFHLWALFMETVLIVEDEAATRDILVELLHKDRRDIVTAGDGQEALERLTRVPRPCLIVLDLMMPRMDGWEFLRRQSADPSIA